MLLYNIEFGENGESGDKSRFFGVTLAFVQDCSHIHILRSNRLYMFYKIGFLKKFANFARKYICLKKKIYIYIYIYVYIYIYASFLRLKVAGWKILQNLQGVKTPVFNINLQEEKTLNFYKKAPVLESRC